MNNILTDEEFFGVQAETLTDEQFFGSLEPEQSALGKITDSVFPAHIPSERRPMTTGDPFMSRMSDSGSNGPQGIPLTPKAQFPSQLDRASQLGQGRDYLPPGIPQKAPELPKMAGLPTPGLGDMVGIGAGIANQAFSNTFGINPKVEAQSAIDYGKWLYDNPKEYLTKPDVNRARPGQNRLEIGSEWLKMTGKYFKDILESGGEKEWPDWDVDMDRIASDTFSTPLGTPMDTAMTGFIAYQMGKIGLSGLKDINKWWKIQRAGKIDEQQIQQQFADRLETKFRMGDISLKEATNRAAASGVTAKFRKVLGEEHMTEFKKILMDEYVLGVKTPPPGEVANRVQEAAKLIGSGELALTKPPVAPVVAPQAPGIPIQAPQPPATALSGVTPTQTQGVKTDPTVILTGKDAKVSGEKYEGREYNPKLKAFLADKGLSTEEAPMPDKDISKDWEQFPIVKALREFEKAGNKLYITEGLRRLAPLEQEALKYPDAESFVKSQGKPLLHFTKKENVESIKKEGLRAAEKSEAFITEGISLATKRTESNEIFGDTEVPVYINPNAKTITIKEALDEMGYADETNLGVIKNVEHRAVTWAKDNGYDVLDMREARGAVYKGMDEIRVLNPNVVKTHEQLKKVFQQAHTEQGVQQGKEPWEMTKGEFRATHTASPVPGMDKDNVTFIGRDGKPTHMTLTRKEGIYPVDRAMDYGYHQDWVKKALKDGKPVPKEVLADYPELQQGIPQQKPPAPKGIPRSPGYQRTLDHRQKVYDDQAKTASTEKLNAELVKIGKVPSWPEDGINLMRKQAIEAELLRRKAPSGIPQSAVKGKPTEQHRVSVADVEGAIAKAQELGGVIRGVEFKDEVKYLDPNNEDDIQLLSNYEGITQEDIDNAKANGTRFIIAASHQHGTEGSGPAGAYITLYHGAEKADLNEELGHLISAQGGLPGWQGKEEAKAKYIADLLNKGEAAKVSELTPEGSKIPAPKKKKGIPLKPKKKPKGIPQKKKAPIPATGLQDFGEKLGGAKKDRVNSVDKTISDKDLAGQPLSKIWPKKEVDDIEDPNMAALAHSLRSEVPSKPRQRYKVQRWVESVKLVRSLMQYANENGFESTLKKISESGPELKAFANKINLLRKIDRAEWGRIGKVKDYPTSYSYIGSDKKSSPYSVAQVDKRFVKGDNLDDLAVKVIEKLSVKKVKSSMKFEVRGSERGGYFINKKGDSLYRKLKTFDNSKDALDYRNEHQEDLVQAWEDVKETDNVKEVDVRRSENRPRTGKDHRVGKDATPEMFLENFGFRGVEFGNWVSQGKNLKERQGMLNASYDALMDLADILGIPSKAISLNGQLGLGLGSRGSGWASAHYEPDKVVINLTKTRGAGSLAHEWFHAVDNYFQKARGTRGIGSDANFITFGPENYYESPDGQRMSETRYDQIKDKPWMAGGNWKLIKGVRPKVAEAFTKLVKALNDSPMHKRSSLIDRGKSKGYWSKVIERAARSFENYIIAKMQRQGYMNDYLANVVDATEFVRDSGRYPYLLEEELPPVEEAFDDVFSAIETRETEKGVELFSIRKEPEWLQNTAKKGIPQKQEEKLVPPPKTPDAPEVQLSRIARLRANLDKARIMRTKLGAARKQRQGKIEEALIAARSLVSGSHLPPIDKQKAYGRLATLSQVRAYTDKRNAARIKAIEGIINKVEHSNAVASTATKLKGLASGLPTMQEPFRGMVTEMVGRYQKSAPTKKTLQKLETRQEWLDRLEDTDPDAAARARLLPDKLFEELNRLTRVPLKDLGTEELNELGDYFDRLKAQDKLKGRLLGLKRLRTIENAIQEVTSAMEKNQVTLAPHKRGPLGIAKHFFKHGVSTWVRIAMRLGGGRETNPLHQTNIDLAVAHDGYLGHINTANKNLDDALKIAGMKGSFRKWSKELTSIQLGPLQSIKVTRGQALAFLGMTQDNVGPQSWVSILGKVGLVVDANKANKGVTIPTSDSNAKKFTPEQLQYAWYHASDSDKQLATWMTVEMNAGYGKDSQIIFDLTGRRPGPEVPNRYPRTRERRLSIPRLAEKTKGDEYSVYRAENEGHYQARTGGKMPGKLQSIFNMYDQIARSKALLRNMAQPIRDSMAIYGNPRVMKMISQRIGIDGLDQLFKTLNYTATGGAASGTKGIERGVALAERKVAGAVLPLRATTALIQPVSALYFTINHPYLAVLKGYGKYIMHPKKNAKELTDAIPTAYDRYYGGRMLTELSLGPGGIPSVDPKALGEKASRLTFYGDKVALTALYEALKVEATDKGLSGEALQEYIKRGWLEEVMLSQPGGPPIGASGTFIDSRERPALRLITFLGSQRNKIANMWRAVNDEVQMSRDRLKISGESNPEDTWNAYKQAARTVAAVGIAALMVAIIREQIGRQLIRGKEPPEKPGGDLALDTVGNIVGSVYGLGEMYSAIRYAAEGWGSGVRMGAVSSVIESVVGATSSVYKYIEAEIKRDPEKANKQLLKSLEYLSKITSYKFGIPTYPQELLLEKIKKNPPNWPHNIEDEEG